MINSNLTGEELNNAFRESITQEHNVMKVVRSNQDKKLTARIIWGLYRKRFKYAELSSIRRAVTVLMNEGKLRYKMNEGKYIIHRSECIVRKGYKVSGRLIVINN